MKRVGTLLSTSIIVALCAGPVAASADDYQDAYTAAIEDAAVPETNEIKTDLVALNLSNTDLVTRGTGRWTEVKVATFMSDDSYQKYYAGKSQGTTPDSWGVIWATVVPQFQEFCSALPDGTDTAFRMKQWLGLNPAQTYEIVVELWVPMTGMVRPCPDPDPTDAECRLVMPGGVAASYRDWFNGNFVGSYNVNGFPWTRLGYTFDWALVGDAIPAGGSEFILGPNVTYDIVGGQSVEAYCTP